MANLFEINRTTNKIVLGTTDTTINIDSHSASRLLALDADKDLESVSDLTGWIAGTANQITITDDTDGSVTLSTPQDIHTDATPEFNDIILGDWQLGTPTYNSVHDWMNTIQSAGRISGGDFTDNEDGTLTVAAGTGMIKTTDSRTGVTLTFDWEENTDVQTDEETPEGLTDQATNHIYIDYKSGSPQIFCTTSISDISFTDKIGLGRVYRDGTSLHMLPGGAPTNDAIQRTHQAIVATLHFHRSSGFQISETGDLGIVITEGVFWRGLRDFPVFTGTGYDSTATDFTLWYNDGTWQSSQTGVLTHHYNDYGTGLVATGAQKYGNFWVYICHDGHVHVVYGLGNYKYAEAIAAAAPANLPTIVSDFAMLLARITVKTEETSTFTNISTPWDSEIISGTVTRHDSLSNLTFADSGHTGFQAQGDVLDDLNTLGAVASDGEFLVGTGAGTFAWESGATVRTSLGLGTGDSVQFANFEASNKLTACATNAGALDFSAASKILTIENNAIVSQDYSSDALPTFGGLVIANGGTIGQADGPLLTFDDTNNLLNLTGASFSHTRSVDDASMYGYRFYKDRADGIVVSNDSLGYFRWYGHDGTGYIPAAELEVVIDAIPDTDDMPGKFRFKTTPEGGSATVTRFAIGSEGGIFMPALKSGTDQADAGAAAAELYVDTNDDNTVKMGV